MYRNEIEKDEGPMKKNLFLCLMRLKRLRIERLINVNPTYAQLFGAKDWHKNTALFFFDNFLC